MEESLIGDENTLIEEMARLLEEVRAKKPLVHNITNWVVTNVTANILLAAGASPVMAHAKEEVEEMVSIADALVLNIGTLTSYLVESMILAGKKANFLGVPVILDPVGAGATGLRTDAARKILSEVKVDILRGNSSEISVVAGFGGASRGVDSGTSALSGEGLAFEAAKNLGCVVAVTGKTDYVSDAMDVIAVDNGHELLTRVTGTGCMATSLIGAFAGVAVKGSRETCLQGSSTGANVKKKCLVAAASALAFFGYSAERAGALAKGPGSFQVALFDSVHSMSVNEFKKGARARVLGPSAR